MDSSEIAENRCLPLEAWPAEDRAAWLSALEPAGFLEGDKIAPGWSDGGRQMALYAYGFWLTWLARTGQLDSGVSPASRVTLERVTTYLESMRPRLAPMTVQGRIGQLGKALRAIAPEGDWIWLLRASSRLRQSAEPVRLKRPRMQESDTLSALGFSLMQRAEAIDDHFAIARATFYRDGLMIALLAHRPLRMRTFAAITIDQHLVQRDSVWWLQFGPEETKTKQALEMPVPEALVPSLERYLAVHRPILVRGRPKPGAARPNTAALWIAKGGRMMGSSAISVQIRTHTQEAFGQSVNPHLFRDCAATSIAIQDPKHVRMIMPILGHATSATAERHYNQARTLEAVRRYQKQIARTRRAAATPAS